MLTGCAHPGIVEIVRQVSQWGQVDLIVGGFHLLEASPTQVANVIEELQALGVRRVAPRTAPASRLLHNFAQPLPTILSKRVRAQ